MGKINTKRFIEIGRKEECSTQELHIFLPSFPTLHGNEDIFKFGWVNSKKYFDKDVELLIKGLHIIEMKYKLDTSYAIGFGSPSPTYKLIRALEEVDKELAENLTEWIRERGGNYYIKARSE